MKGIKFLEKAGKVVSEAVENIRTVQALNRQTTFYDQYCQNLEKPFRFVHVYDSITLLVDKTVLHIF